ncbi:hypothetical protein EC890511_3423, partial [Escherichia coli 89.0511]
MKSKIIRELQAPFLL